MDPNGGAYDLKWDLEAIRWLLDNVVGSPVILEGHAPEYRWGGRYSINTGLPTVLGWNWHQRQQRAAADDQEVWNRVGEISTIYNTLDWDQAESLLDKYNVRYIVVAPWSGATMRPPVWKSLTRWSGKAGCSVCSATIRSPSIRCQSSMRAEGERVRHRDKPPYLGPGDRPTLSAQRWTGIACSASVIIYPVWHHINGGRSARRPG